MTTTWIGTSWKMNKTLAQSEAFCIGLKQGLKQTPLNKTQAFVIPPFTSLSLVSSQLSDCDVMVGAQNMCWAEHGAFTGEISAQMIKDCGASIVELGHSERREYFAETDLRVNAKIKTALNYGLRPLICLGDSADQKNSHCSLEFVLCQLKQSIIGLSTEQISKLLFAYEPIWAIGEHGQAALPSDIEPVHIAIKQYLASLDPQLEQLVPLLYGGSVNPNNAVQILECEAVNGLFIGRSAWQVEGYLDILQRCQ